MKKYIVFVTATICLAIAVEGQQVTLFKNSKELWGYKDKNGKVVVEPKYYYKPPAFTEGRTIVTLAGLKGLLDATGKEVLPPTYASISDFKYGFALAAKEITDTANKVNGKPVKRSIKGVIDRNGKEIVPVKYKEIRGDFSNGWFVRVWDYPENKIFYNTDGSSFTVPDSISLFDDRIDGKKFIAMKKGKYGVIDRQFKELLPFEYSRIIASENGLLIVMQNNYYGLMDAKLKWIAKPSFSNIQQFKNGYAIISNEEKLLGAINAKGIVTTAPQFEKLARIDKTGSAIAIYNGTRSDRQGLVDLATGKIITPANYNMSAYDYDWGIITFRRDNKKGMMDSTGKELFYDAYDDFPRGFLDNRTWVIKQNKYGFIDKTGALVIPAKYDVVNGFSEGLAKVKLDGRCGFIDINGSVIIPLTFADAGSFESGIAWVKDDSNRSFYIDRTGKEVK